MNVKRLAAIPRLARRSLVRLLDMRASVAHHPPLPLKLGERTSGYLEFAHWSRYGVRLGGWWRDGEFSIGIAGPGLQIIRPWIERQDVMEAHPDAPLRTGFELELDRHPRHAGLVVMAGDIPILEIPPPSATAEMQARLRAVPGALHYAGGHGRDILRFLRTGDAGLSLALRDAFGFGDGADGGPLINSDLFSSEPAQETLAGAGTTVIIIPVFNASDDVDRLLTRLERSVGTDHHLLIIDDGSTDPRIAPLLDGFEARNPERTTVERMPENRGFVATVNHGLERARSLGNHVILLNTDTIPPKGWAARLIQPILDDAGIASVTPVSNTAEIASVPAQGVETTLTEDLVDAVDDVARRLGPAHNGMTLPTGIGFAMAMNRRFIDRVGSFDTAFGRGYGEEVDWCQKARRAGGRHVLATSVFIGHAGGASFGAPEKLERVREAGRIITGRYPGYDREVQEWAHAAPHAVPRLALSLAWLGAVSTGPVPVFLGHVLGGGAEMALRRDIDKALAAGAPGVVILRAGGSTAWRIQVEGPGFVHSCRVQNTRLIHEMLGPLKARRVVYSCGVGAREPRDVPELLIDLAGKASHSLEIGLHDFFPVSPSYCLLDASGKFSGAPKALDRDPAHNAAMPLAEWQGLWSRVIDRADRIVAYSRPSAAIFTSVYPAADTKTVVVPHEMPSEMPQPVPPGGRNIGVLGGINQAKGADVLMSLARHLRTGGSNRRIVVVGDLDPNYRLPEPHRVLGKYRRSQISELARQNGIGLWLIPSVWPETFSFTTREALATRLPVLTFDLGAQAEAARAASNGVVVTSEPDNIAALSDQIEASASLVGKASA